MAFLFLKFVNNLAEQGTKKHREVHAISYEADDWQGLFCSQIPLDTFATYEACVETNSAL